MKNSVMRQAKYILSGLALLLFTTNAAYSKGIVSIGGSVTEILFALDEGDNIVGVDTSSTYPKKIEAAMVGYKRALSSEGILSLSPDLLILEEDSGPSKVIKQIKKSNVEILEIANSESIDSLMENIDILAGAVNKTKEAKELKRKIHKDMKAVAKHAQNMKSKPRVMVVAGFGPNAMVAGQGTSAEEVLKLSGAINNIDAFSNYKSVSAEYLSTVEADIIVLVGITQKSVSKEIKNLPAFKKGNVIYYDDILLFLGFTPRVGEMLKDLQSKYAKYGF